MTSRLTTSMLLTLALLLALAGLAQAATETAWDQDFTDDAGGWDDTDDGWYGTVTHNLGDGTATFEGDGVSGPFSFFDGARDTFGAGWIAEIDAYLDPAWADGEGFDYSVASYGTDGVHQRDFIFHVAKDSDTGDLLVGGSNNTNFNVREDLETINHHVVTEAGWYTLQHVARDDAGILTVDMNLLDADGTVLWTETRSDEDDTIPAEVGGNGYAWFTVIDVDGGVEADNHELHLLLPDPGSKDDCKKGGWADYGFANQGQCIRFVNTGQDSRG